MLAPDFSLLAKFCAKIEIKNIFFENELILGVFNSQK